MKKPQFHSGLTWTTRDGITDSEIGRKLYHQALADCLKRQRMVKGIKRLGQGGRNKNGSKNSLEYLLRQAAESGRAFNFW